MQQGTIYLGQGYEYSSQLVTDTKFTFIYYCTLIFRGQILFIE